MPDWLIWVLFGLLQVLVNLALIAFFARRAFDRGYDAGMDDALAFDRYVEDVLKKGTHE